MILDVLEQKLRSPVLLEKLGGLAVSLVQKNIEQGSWGPNAALTVSVKRGSKPLRDRGNSYLR